jgi:hypothetical protein
MQRAVQFNSNNWIKGSRTSLWEISQLLEVPIVFATKCDGDSIRTHSTFGLDLAVNWSAFAAVIDSQCIKGATVVPNVETHQQLARWSRTLIDRDIRFLAGIPISDVDGRRVGSIAVIANQKMVARKGIAIRRLGELGREFFGVADA